MTTSINSNLKKNTQKLHYRVIPINILSPHPPYHGGGGGGGYNPLKATPSRLSVAQWHRDHLRNTRFSLFIKKKHTHTNKKGPDEYFPSSQSQLSYYCCNYNSDNGTYKILYSRTCSNKKTRFHTHIQTRGDRTNTPRQTNAN